MTSIAWVALDVLLSDFKDGSEITGGGILDFLLRMYKNIKSAATTPIIIITIITAATIPPVELPPLVPFAFKAVVGERKVVAGTVVESCLVVDAAIVVGTVEDVEGTICGVG